MMTKAIWVLIIVVIGYIGYAIFQQWDKARIEHDTGKQAAAAVGVQGEGLPGMPPQLESGMKAAKERGPAAFRTWFNANQALLSDPRKAWIQLDLCVAMTRENPSEAKQIYADVKKRVPPSSPVWARMKELEKTFE